MGVAFVDRGSSLFILFVAVFFLFPEIESHVDTQASKRVGHGESGFPVIIGVEYEGGSYIIFAVVPGDSGTGNQIEIDVSDPLGPVGSTLGRLVVDAGLFVGDGWKQGNVQQTVLGKYPVVAITNAEVVISVAQAVEFQGGAELLLHLIGQLGVVEGDVVL